VSAEPRQADTSAAGPAGLDDTQRAARDQFGRQSARYGSGHLLADVADVEAALALLDGLPAPADALDVATANGHTALCLAARGHRVTASDLSEAMLERCAAAARERGLEVATACHPAEAVPFPDAAFDLVTCRVAAHHFSRPQAFVAEAARVLRPGGWFLLIDGSVPDGEPVAEAWTHEVEKLRDPSHGRFLGPGTWRAICAEAGLVVAHAALAPMKMPDLEWYFETAATPAPNRSRVRELVRDAPEAARRVFQIGSEAGKTVWWWQRLTLVARKPEEDRRGSA
jgi:SAM-dependent methyltransferase